jgi:MerR family mercuric resistance operon transcriptional regulator
MKVGEVARRSGVNVETLRYYERRGLLPPPDREPRTRRYDEDTGAASGPSRRHRPSALP